jgi:hypothetical protein
MKTSQKDTVANDKLDAHKSEIDQKIKNKDLPEKQNTT